jgi:hypothetical protein
MKVRQVLVKVTEPGRLRKAWQKVRANAGAAGLDRMTVEEFAQREEELELLVNREKMNKYLRGWVGYFGIQELKYLFRDLDDWIRSRLRSMQLKKWKKPGKFQRVMIKAGFDPDKHTVYGSR